MSEILTIYSPECEAEITVSPVIGHRGKSAQYKINVNEKIDIPVAHDDGKIVMLKVKGISPSFLHSAIVSSSSVVHVTKTGLTMNGRDVISTAEGQNGLPVKVVIAIVIAIVILIYVWYNARNKKN